MQAIRHLGSSLAFQRFLLSIVLIELIGVLAVGADLAKTYRQWTAASEDVNWNVYQLDREYQRLMIATLDGSTPGNVRLRAQIFVSRLNILKHDAIFADVRSKSFSAGLDGFFKTIQPVIEQAGAITTTDDVRTLKDELAKDSKIITTLTQTATEAVRTLAAEKKVKFESLIIEGLSTILVLGLTVSICTWLWIRSARRLDDAIAEAKLQGNALVKVWDQVKDPLILFDSQLSGLGSVEYANPAALGIFASPEGDYVALLRAKEVLGKIGHHPSASEPILIGKRHYLYTEYVLGHLQIAERGRMVLVRLLDITEKVESVERSRNLLRRLTEAEQWRFIGSAAATVLHEIRQPLSAASNYLFVASDFATNAEGSERLPYLIDRSMEMLFRIQQTVQQLRSLIPTDRSAWEVVPVFSLVNEAKNIIEASDAFRTKIEVLQNEAVNCRGSSIQLTQVFINILRNALEASDRKGSGLRVVATISDEGQYARIDIADAAGGIAPEVMDHLFEPVPSKKLGGMGIGLAISQHLAETHGGHLSWHHNNEGGTTFTVRIPVPLSQNKIEEKTSAEI
jgi:C4-dicarboxylate-specific signal transduction histidine kinase